MDVVDFANAVKREQLSSEEDVRAKVVTRLLDILGYPSECISYEARVYYDEGRSKRPPKKADAICFAEKTPEPNREQFFSSEYRDKTIIVVEVKNPGESLSEARAQAEFYAYWTRSPFYLLTNGAEFSFYETKLTVADKAYECDDVDDLVDSWATLYERFSYDHGCLVKKSAVNAREKVRPLFAGYCRKLIGIELDDDLERTFEEKERHDKIAEEDAFPLGESIFVVGDPGIGKTSCLERLASRLAASYLEKGEGPVPVLVRGRGWGRRFKSIYEAVGIELSEGAEALPVRSVLPLADSICVIVDGVDEARVDRDLLFDDLLSLRGQSGSWLVCSSRNESDAALVGLRPLRLEPLSDNAVSAYLRKHVSRRSARVPRDLSASGRELLKNPMHLRHYVSFLLEGSSGEIPRNMAQVYGFCIDRMLQKAVLGRGIDISSLKSYLGEFAFEDLVNPAADPFVKFMAGKVGPVAAGDLLRVSVDGGVLVLDCEGARFSHAVLGEYLAADYLASRDVSSIAAFCHKHDDDASLGGFFELLCGCARATEKQDAVLDCLEDDNLALYMRCLRGRLNLSGEMRKNLSRSDVESIAAKALHSYQKIFDKYLGGAKSYIPFWQSLSSADARLSADVSYGPSTSVMHIALKESDENAPEIALSLSEDDQGPVIKTQGGAVMPLLSIRSSAAPEMHCYRLDHLFGGIDCAREIAVSMVMDDMNCFFSSILAILSEPLGMRVGFIEDSLRRCSNRCSLQSGGHRRMSVKTFTAKQVDETLSARPCFTVNVNGTEIPSGYLPFLVKSLEFEDREEVLRLIPPEPDNLGEGRYLVWDVYKDEICQSWVGVALAETEKCYRQYVETFFVGLAPSLPTYADGPIGVVASIEKGADDDFASDRHIKYAPFPIEYAADVRTEFVEDYFTASYDFSEFLKRAQVYASRERLLGRPGKGYHETSCGSAQFINNRSCIRDAVLKRVKKEIKELFRLRRG